MSFSNCLTFPSSARYIDRSFDQDQDDDDTDLPYHYYKNQLYPSREFERFLRRLVVSDMNENDKDDETLHLQRRYKAITKGDPREFMG